MAEVEDRSESEPPAASGVSITFEAHAARISLSGDVDMAMASGLDFVAQEAIVRALPIEVEVSRVTFMDSTGVGFFARLVRAGAESGQRLTVVGPSRRVRETLSVAGLLPVLELHEAETRART